MISIRTSFAAALMCGAMALPAAAAGVDTGANAQANGGNVAADTQSQSGRTAMNSGANAQANDGNAAADEQSPSSQTAMNQPGQSSQAGMQASGEQSGALAMNESAIRDVGGDTSQKYSARTRSSDNQKEADITARLNQKQAQMASRSTQGEAR